MAGPRPDRKTPPIQSARKGSCFGAEAQPTPLSHYDGISRPVIGRLGSKQREGACALEPDPRHRAADGGGDDEADETLAAEARLMSVRRDAAAEPLLRHEADKLCVPQRGAAFQARIVDLPQRMEGTVEDRLENSPQHALEKLSFDSFFQVSLLFLVFGIRLRVATRSLFLLKFQ